MDALAAKYGLVILMVTGIGIAGCLTLCVWGWIVWARHRYIRAGETLLEYDYNDTKGIASKVLRIEGWGKYAAVMLDPVGAIRRDQIRKDENGNWFYRYDD